MRISKCNNITRSSFCKRYCSTNNSVNEKKDKNSYSHTVNLPSTKFPLWVKPLERVKLDEKVYNECGFSNLYSWQSQCLKDKEEFILHDGPPYANGSPHMGHAVNKILKDITLRYNLLQNKKVNYVPGWDCHGLPIELKAITSKEKGLSGLELRQKARNFALETIKSQKSEFKSWGVLADWENNCYHTFDKNYVKNQLQQFYTLYTQNYIYRDLKPVYFSPSSRTALAESELEYKRDHISKSIYLKLPLNDLSPQLSNIVNSSNKVYALIWTTTPWSLPANQFIAFRSTLDYCIVEINGDLLIVAECLVETLSKSFEKVINVLSTFPGHYLEGCAYQHPLNNNLAQFIPADFVSSSKGTGLVHCAPAHGQDDFLLALKKKIPVINLVDGKGKYCPEVGNELNGLNVMTEGRDKVLAMLENNIVHHENYVHSYPYDWRTKKPVMLKASRQWFIDTEQIKSKAIECLEEVKFFPETAKNSLIDQIEKRPYWCISRQRVWGVPIPVFYDQDQILINESDIQRYCSMVDKHSPDFWWLLSNKELYTESNKESIVKSEDILDIWFDSGISWSHVLKGKVANVYMEGMDQINGWFMSSLLTSVALKQRSPFKNVFLHGFVVDEKGSKMSKSLGNVISAYDVMHGTKKLPALGVDVLRWWVAAHASKDPTVPMGKNILTSSQEDVQKIRSSLRYILGVLYDFDPTSIVNNERNFDVYITKRLIEFEDQIEKLYEDFQYAKATRLIINFVTNDLSGLYFSSIKDRVYCDLSKGPGRLSCQNTLNNILNILLRTIAPIMPHLTEEVYMYHPYLKDKIFFHSSKSDLAKYKNKNIEHIEMALQLRDDINRAIPDSTNRWKLHVNISAADNVYSLLNDLLTPKSNFNCDSELCEIFQVSSIDLTKSDSLSSGQFKIEIKNGSGSYCPRCRRFTMFSPHQNICSRCQTSIDSPK